MLSGRFKRTVLFVIAFSALSFISANAQVKDDTQKQNAQQTNMQRGQRFVDADKDGVCDNFKSGTAGYGTNGQRGPRFVDADKDGVCDNFKNKANGQGQRNGKGKMNGKHQCRQNNAVNVKDSVNANK